MNIIVWDTAFFADPLQALAQIGSGFFWVGQSTIFNYTIPAAGSPPSAYLPANQLPFYVGEIPEPGTIGLTALGAAAWLLLRRRNNL
jgi:hypothetical protein